MTRKDVTAQADKGSKVRGKEFMKKPKSYGPEREYYRVTAERQCQGKAKCHWRIQRVNI